MNSGPLWYLGGVLDLYGLFVIIARRRIRMKDSEWLQKQRDHIYTGLTPDGYGHLAIEALMRVFDRLDKIEAELAKKMADPQTKEEKEINAWSPWWNW